MNIRFVLYFAIAAGLSSLTGAMQNCDRLSDCLGSDAEYQAAAPTRVDETDNYGLTPQEALEVDLILTALIEG